MISDKINLYKDYSSIDLNCLACLKNNHLINECPKIQYIIDKEKVLKKFCFSKNQVQRKFMFRKNNRVNSLFQLKKFKKIDNFSEIKIGLVPSDNDFMNSINSSIKSIKSPGEKLIVNNEEKFYTKKNIIQPKEKMYLIFFIFF